MSRKIIIFGATSAIAVETAKIFASKGAELFLVGRNEEKLNIVQQDLTTRGAKQVVVEVANINDFERHQEIIDRAKEQLGDFDTVLVAHGTLGDQTECQKSYELASVELRTNFLSVVSLLTPIANYFEEKRSGTIAVISSVAGDRGRKSNYVYGTAKAAVATFLQGLRNRLYEKNVAVVDIRPGFVDTPMTKEFKKGALFVGPAVVAKGIVSAIEKRKDIVYLPWFWWGIMLIIRNIPEFIFKRLSL